jgi:hypothetical protein
VRPMPSSNLGSGERHPESKRERVHNQQAVEVMRSRTGGGAVSISHCASPGVWHIGLQRSVREWAMRQGWGGRPVRQEQAQGILVAALGMLAAHFGHVETKRAS